MKLFPVEIIKYNLANSMGSIICENLTEILNAFFFFEMKKKGTIILVVVTLKWESKFNLKPMGILTWPDILQILLSTLGTHNGSDTILTHKEIKELSAYTK